LQIQQSHYFTVDTFTNFFMFLAIYFAVEIAFGGWRMADGGWQIADSRWQLADSRWQIANGASPSTLHTSRFTYHVSRITRDPLTWLSLGFGLALGMAVASKLNAAVLAIVLPAAFALRYFRANRRQETEEPASLVTRHSSLVTRPSLERIIILLVIGALASLLAFRLFQPYAFSGPGFFGVTPNEKWIANIKEQRTQASGDADVPFALQWARRSHLFSFENLTVWGLGLPLGILAWAGFLWMGWRILKGEWRQHALLWGWTALYFLWQSLQFNPTMRYQLPIYPLLAMMAAWVIFRLAGWKVGRLADWKVGKLEGSNLKTCKRANLPTILSIILGVIILILTILWAFAFTRIYTRTRRASRLHAGFFKTSPGRSTCASRPRTGVPTSSRCPSRMPTAFKTARPIVPALPPRPTAS